MGSNPRVDAVPQHRSRVSLQVILLRLHCFVAARCVAVQQNIDRMRLTNSPAWAAELFGFVAANGPRPCAAALWVQWQTRVFVTTRRSIGPQRTTVLMEQAGP
jgi:hypothetical protein